MLPLPAIWGQRLVVSAILVGHCYGTAVFTNSVYDLVVDTPFNLTWESAVGAVQIQLVSGLTPPFDALQVLDSDDTSSWFIWTPPSNDAGRTWAFQISDLTDHPNYSALFTIAAAANTSSQASSTTMPATPISSATSSVQTGQGSAAIGAGSTASSPSTASASAQSTSSSDSGLSVGAKAGIGIGAGLGGLAVLGALCLLAFRQGKASAKAKTIATVPEQPTVAELGHVDKKRPELEASVVAEMQTQNNTPELAGQQRGTGYTGYPAGPVELG